MPHFLTLWLLLWLTLGTGSAQAKQRFALLIGNQNYTEDVGRLQNPHNDVDLIGASLRKLGFKVHILKDASYRKMDIAVRRHVERTRRAGDDAVGFFYYSGHGVANPDTKQNYLVPIDVTSADDADIWYESFQQTEVINRLVRNASNATHYVVFDACRDELQLSGPSAKSLGKNKGFVPVADTSGILIAYATAPGQTAADVGQGSGPYAKALALELLKPGVEAVSMFRSVQLQVKRAIGQDPWLSFPALPAIYLAGEKRKPVLAAVPPAIAAPTFSQQAELAFWNAVKDSEDPAVLETYIRQYPRGTFAALARVLLQKRKMSVEKQTLARIKQEELRVAQEKKRRAQEARDRAELKARQALQSEALIEARAEAKRAREALKAAEKQRASALQAARKAREQRELAQRDLEQAKNTKVAALEPSGAAAPSDSISGPQPGSTTPADKRELARSVQRELKRLGCYTSAIDGIWGSGSNRSLKNYAKFARARFDEYAPTREVLESLTAKKKRVCPVVAVNPPNIIKKKKVDPKRSKAKSRKARAEKKNCISFNTCMSRCRNDSEPTFCPGWCSGEGRKAGYFGKVC